MLMRLAHALLALASGATLAACGVDIGGIAPGSMIACTAAGECPADLTCNPNTRRCVAAPKGTDFTPPAIRAPRVIYDPPPGCPLPPSGVTATAPGGRAAVALEVAAGPGATSITGHLTARLDDTAFDLQPLSTAQAGQVFEIEFTGAVPAGATPGNYEIIPTITDNLGSPASPTAIGTIRVAQPLPALNAGHLERIALYRAPWGAAATNGVPAWRAEGSPGAAENGAVVLILSGDTAAGFTLLGFTRAAPDGSFRVPLPGADGRTASVATVNDACQSTGGPLTPKRVQAAAWVARSTGEGVTRSASDPTAITTYAELGSALFPPGGLPRDTGPTGRLQASRADGQGVVSRAVKSWRRLMDSTPNVPEAEALQTVAGHAAAYDAVRGETVLFGGTNTAGEFPDASAYRDMTILLRDYALTAAAPAERPSARRHAALVFDAARGEALLFGGEGPDGALNDTWIWDGTAWSQRFLTPSPPARSAHAAAYDPSGRGVVVFGGRDSSGKTLGDTWFYDGAAWSEIRGEGPQARAFAAMAADGDAGGAVLFGGETGTKLWGDTWVFRSGRWSEASPAEAPEPLSRAGMAAHPDGVILTGGRGVAGALQDTWLWDGQNWTREAEPGPSCDRCTMAAGPGGEVLLVGGVTAARLQPEFWVRGPKGWQSHGAISGPRDMTRFTVFWRGTPALLHLFDGQTGAIWRRDEALRGWRQLAGGDTGPGAYLEDDFEALQIGAAYDSARGALVVLLLGRAAHAGPSTWEWDGDWAQIPTPDRPPVRGQFAMAYDEGSRRTIIFGGRDAGANFDDTWAFDGENWRPVAPGAGPSPRAGAGMAYDYGLKELVLFGGDDDNFDRISDTWTLQDDVWMEIPSDAAPTDVSDPVLGYLPGAGAVALLNEGAGLESGEPGERPGRAGGWVLGPAGWEHVPLPCGLIDELGEVAAGYDPGSNQTAVVNSRGGVAVAGADGSVFVAPEGARPGWMASGPGETFDIKRGAWVVIESAGGNCTRTWYYDGRWQADPVVGEGPDSFAVLAYDSASESLVAYGPARLWDDTGAEVEAAATWILGDEGWVLQGANAPPLRFGGLVDAAPLGGLTLFGGGADFAPGFKQFTSSEYVSTLWTWSEGAWANLAGSMPETKPYAYAMAYDAKAKRVLLAGGAGAGGQALSEIWAWNRSEWQKVGDRPAMGLRYDSRMAFDRARGRAVLFGGDEGDGETWELAGSKAELIPAWRAPSARSGAAFSYDPAGERILMYGGYDNAAGAPVNDMWAYDGSRRARPGVVWSVVLSGVPLEGIDKVVLDGVAGGTGYAVDDAREARAGAELWAWNTRAGRWTSLGANTASAPEAGPLRGEIAGPGALADLLMGRDGALHFAVVPKNPNGSGHGEVVLDALEITVHYREP